MIFNLQSFKNTVLHRRFRYSKIIFSILCITLSPTLVIGAPIDPHDSRTPKQAADARVAAETANLASAQKKATQAEDELNVIRASGTGHDDALGKKRDADIEVAKSELAKAKAERAAIAADPNQVDEEIDAADEKVTEAEKNLNEKESSVNAVKSNPKETFGFEKFNVNMEDLIKKSSKFTLEGNVSVKNEHKLVLSGDDDENNILYRMINVLIKTLGTVAILLYVVGGFFIITSQGDENQLQKGKTIVIYTSLGLIIAFGSYIMVSIVMSAAFNIGK